MDKKPKHSEFTMYILGRPNNKMTVVNPIVIPRIGEQVFWLYEPNPVVQNIVYDYSNNAVYVYVE